MTTTPFEEEATTVARRLHAVHTSPPPSADAPPLSMEELLGKVMAATQANTVATNAMSVRLGTLERELTQHTRAAVEHKDEIKEATTAAAKHGSNRLALLFGALITVYEIAAPVLHDVAQWLQHSGHP